MLAGSVLSSLEIANPNLKKLDAKSKPTNLNIAATAPLQPGPSFCVGFPFAGLRNTYSNTLARMGSFASESLVTRITVYPSARTACC